MKGAPRKSFCLRGHAIAIVGRNTQGACIACAKDYHKEYSKRWRQTERGKWTATHRNKVAIRKYGLKQRYGLSLSDWQKMFDFQKGCCLICGRHQSEIKRSLCVDHNHETGKIRGLLCAGCNVSVGFYEKHRSAIEKYLGDTSLRI